MNNVDKQYLKVASQLLEQAEKTPNRTDTSAYKLFGEQLKFDLREGFPLLTSKKVHIKSIIHELLWFLKGDTRTHYLNSNGVRIWDEWADDSGNLGPVYGAQWRKWEDIKIVDFDSQAKQWEGMGYRYTGDFYPNDGMAGGPRYVMRKEIDQIQSALDDLRSCPEDRRVIVTAYNPGVKPTTKLTPRENASIGLQALPPCHLLFQFNTSPVPEELIRELRETTDDPESIPTHYLDLQMYQRSADWFLGVPFNIASYALLQMMFAQQLNMVPRNLIHTFGDYHIYENHVEQIREQLKQPLALLPTMTIRKAKDIDSYKIEDFVLENYVSGPTLKGKVAV